MLWVRKQLFRWAFKGCKAEDPQALEYARKTAERGSLEDDIRIERALVLDYWAKWIGGRVDRSS